MKKIMKNTLVLAVLFTALLANASLHSINDVKKTTLILNNVEKGDELLIKNTHGIILYNELIQNSGDYRKGFDLTKLPNGDYIFELNKVFKIVIIPFHVLNKTVVFKKEKESIIFKPYVRNKKNKAYISKLSLNNQPLEIQVFYEDIESTDFNLIYSETIKDSNNIGRILNLDRNRTGKYRIVTKTEGRTFVDYIQF